MRFRADIDKRQAARLINRLKAMGPQGQNAVKKALHAKALQIMADSVKITPVDKGPLRASAYVAPDQGKKENPIVEIGFGTDYAVPVHEREDLTHKAPTRDHFLSIPYNAHQRGFTQWVALKAREFFTRGGGTVTSQFPTRPKVQTGKGK